jgi:hypothetical protein
MENVFRKSTLAAEGQKLLPSKPFLKGTHARDFVVRFSQSFGIIQ